MTNPTYTSPTPSNSGGESSVAASPLGLQVGIANNIHPNIQTYTIAALSGYNATTLPLRVMGGTGRLFFVQNNQATNVLVVGPSGVGVVVLAGTLVLLAADVSGDVVAISYTGVLPDPTAPTQAAWFIDATLGNDTNPGTALLPIKTHAELERRMGNQTMQQSTDITIVGSLPGTDPINIRWKAAPGIVVRYLQGAPDTIDASGSVLASTPINRATNTPQDISTLGGNFDAFLGKKIVKTGGPGTWQVAWLAKIIVAGNRYRISPAVSLPTIPTITPTVITPTPTDTFDVRTSPSITLGTIEDMGPVGSLTFNRFEIDFNGALASILMQEQITFQECGQVDSYTMAGVNTIAWRACKTGTQTLGRPGAHTYSSCLVFGAISQQIGGSQTLFTGDTLVQGAVGGGPGLGGITATDFARVTFANAATFDASAVSVLCQRMAEYRASAAHYGSGSVTQLSLENAVGVYTTLPTAVGTTQDCLVGGRARAFNATPAQVPWIDAGPLGSNSAFVLAGAAASPVTADKIGAYNARFGEYVSCDPTAAGFTVTLPTITAAWPDAEVTVSNVTASANVVTVAAGAGQTVDGAASVPLAAGPSSMTFRSNGGTAWRTVAVAP